MYTLTYYKEKPKYFWLNFIIIMTSFENFQQFF